MGITTDAKPKLTYFNLTGRGLPSRVALFNAFGKEGWTDDRVEFADFPKLKATNVLPLQQMPVLELPDGQRITQSDSIVRWAGKQGDNPLYPTDMTEALLVDEFCALLADILTKIPKSEDKAEAKKLMDEYVAGFLTISMTLLDKRIKGPFLLGNKISIADLTFYSTQDVIRRNLVGIPPEILSKWPKFDAHHQAVAEHKLVKQYLDLYEVPQAERG